MKEVTLPSGAVLKITLAEFEVARNLYQAFLAELKTLDINFDYNSEINMYKDIFCTALSSKAVEAAVWACMARATYNGLRITKDVFEPEEARGDYITVLLEVAMENVLPFMKNLSAQFTRIKERLAPGPA